MFEATLEAKLKTIFNVKKVTFAEPGDSNEQNCVFVEIEQSRQRFKDGRTIARVTGEIKVFGSADNMPFGYFAKAIEQATVDQKAGLAFFDLEKNTKMFQNIVQRSISFVYFFDSQYDPNLGSMSSVNISIEVNP